MKMNLFKRYKLEFILLLVAVLSGGSLVVYYFSNNRALQDPTDPHGEATGRLSDGTYGDYSGVVAGSDDESREEDESEIPEAIEDEPPATPISEPDQPIEGDFLSSELTIKSTSSRSWDMQMEVGSSVYDLLLIASNQYGFSLRVSQHSGLGVFVEEIDGQANDPGTGYYWIYYVNGKLAPVGASAYSLDEGDRVLWQYEKRQTI